MADPDTRLNTQAELYADFVLDGKYKIIERAGQGGMSVVYKAFHLALQRRVAVKVLHRRLIADREALQRFQREITAVASLAHPNIVTVIAAGALETQPYLVMEFLEGENLAAVIERKGRLSKEEALPIFAQILDALDYAHEKGIVHRDLKPSNVDFDAATGKVKLMDFGLAKILPATNTRTCLSGSNAKD